MTTAPFQLSAVTASALLASMIGLFALLRRGHFLTTLVFSSAFLTLAALQAGTIGILQADSPGAARVWATYLAGVSALASWLWLALSLVLARPDPWGQIRRAGAYLTLALVGCVTMFFAASTPYVVRQVDGQGSQAVIVLGTMGKIYLMYLVVVMVAVVMNLERMLRTAAASAQRRLRSMFMAFLIGILSNLLVVSGGLLYGGLRVAWLVATAVPMFVAGTVTALALARRRLSDMSVPVARPVIYYSSVSLTLAGAFLLSMAVLAKLLPMLSAEWKRVVSLAFFLVVGGGGLLLMLSPRVSRAVKRFIDRNFYANRYDYRREWERVSSAITPTARPEDLCRQIEALVGSVFDARQVAIYLLDEWSGGAAGALHLVHGPPAMPARIAPDNPMVRELERTHAPLLLRELAQDLDLLPVVVENREAVQALSAAVCAPLCVGEMQVGLLWLSEKRTDEDYSYEDVEFLQAMSRQLAAALWFARQAEQLAETRQLESLNRLSTFVLHDIKNHVSGLSLVVENARQHLANPEFQRDALGVVERTVANLRELMAQVSAVAHTPELKPEECRIADVVREALQASGLRPEAGSAVRVTVRCADDLCVRADRRMVLRLLTNLLTNACEALNGGGEIGVSAALRPDLPGERRTLQLEVSDNGRGMTADFIRHGLFRPFSTTK
ncbi:MAG: PEP-CTERM system histidine kinase PrsK, partial [Candidatus Eisenbacteria bacterium]|nr:PEP-CTERM system histidine kinase PrsK [Candidatus Eisenbacteria bacterium]